MTAVAWDQVGDRRYEMGLDRGVLYLPEADGVAWNGLTSVDDATAPTVMPAFLDGQKYLQHYVPGDYAGSLKAFTYPDEFEVCVGQQEMRDGFFAFDQKAKPFGLSYRTKIANDEDPDAGYTIHLLYNLIAIQDTTTFGTLTDTPAANEFSWNLTGVPATIDGARPSVHFAFRSTAINKYLLLYIESKLYGNDDLPAILPTPDDILGYIDDYAEFTVTFDGDGHFTINGPDGAIHISPDNKFLVDDLVATWLDAGTYQLDAIEEA